MITRYPKSVLLLTLSIVFSLSAGMAGLGFKNDYRIYFSQENPQLLAFEAIQQIYTKSDNVLFVVEPTDGKVFRPRVLQAIQALTREAWQLPFCSRVDSLTNFQHTTAGDDDLVVADLVGELSALSAGDLVSIEKIALAEPLLRHRLISETGHVAAINVTLQLPEKSPTEVVSVAEHARALMAEIEAQYPEVRLHVTGIAMMNSAFVEAAMNDNMTLVPLMYGIVIVLLLLTLRSVSATVSVVLLILFTITSSLGLFGWFGWHLNPTSAVASTIILTIAVADCIHVLAAFLHAMQQGLDKRHAIQEALRINFKPIALTSLTTTIGFLSMNFSDAPPFRELGNIVAVGVVIALVLTLTLLPALMVLLPVKIRLKTPREKSSLSGLANWVVRWRKPLLLFNTFLGVVLAGIAFNNELNDDFVKYFDETVEFRRATDFLNQNLGGIYSIEVALDTGSEGGISEPLLLRQIDQLVGWLYLQPEVVHVHSITDTFKRLNKNMHSDDNSAYSLPEHRELAAQYLLMYEMSLPYGLDLNDQITIDKSGLRLIITLKSLSTNQILDVEQRINQWVRDHMPEIGYQMASTTLMFSHIGKRNIKSMIFGAFIALGFISLLLVFAFRSIKLGFISLVPNLAPAAMAFGVWALIDGQVGLGLSVVTSITLGIVVDDTIHFISKYRHARVDKGLSSEEAVRYAFSTVGIAIWMTSVVLACGFFVLSFSQFTVNAQMGLLTAITIAIALLMDLLLLPPLLMVLDRK